MAKRTLKEQQQKLVEGYKVGHVRRIIWYRILSVLSAITVFCTTYAMILPALTQEDPTVGVKLAREFYYENDDVAIIFTVTGRAIFKDEHIQIDDPQAELVELEVIEIEEGDDVYDAYAEHLEKGIGSEDLAQILPLELKFSYIGNELDTKRCDITAQIQAKETFFTDEIGAAPQVSEPEADHPMAEPSYKSEPAMALTAIQGNGTNVFDAPTVYTTDVQEISTLTVDVKGTSLTIFSSETLNPKYNVQYYAKIPTIDNTGAYGGTSVEVINTDGKGVPTNGTTPTIMNYYLEEVNGISGKTHRFIENYVAQKIYEDVTGVEYAKAPSHLHIDKIPESTTYELVEVWKLTNKDSTGANDSDWTKYTIPTSNEELLKFRFTNNESATAENKIFISNGDTIRLVYEPKQQAQLEQDLTMYDYDVSDGDLWTGTTGTISSSQFISSQTTSDAYMETYSTTTGNFQTNYRGINSVVTLRDATQRFAFGSSYIGTDLDSFIFNTADANRKGYFGLVETLANIAGDYTPTFVSGVNGFVVPDLFTNVNDHDAQYNLDNENDRFYTANLVAYYDGKYNLGTMTGAGNESVTNGEDFTNCDHDPTSLVWEDLLSEDETKKLTVVKDNNNYFTDDAYRTSGAKITLPTTIGDALAANNITLEIEIGDIRDTGDTTILFADSSEKMDQFRLSIENGMLCFYKNGVNVFDPDGAYNSYIKGNSYENGYDLVAYSTITIVFVNNSDTSGTLYIYCNGARIFYANKNAGLKGAFNVSGKNFFIGTIGSSEANKHTTEYRSIRVHSGTHLTPTNVARNARFNLSRSRIVKSNNYTGYDPQDIGGKKVIGGRDIVFNRVGDTYTLTAINNTMGGTYSLGNLTNLEYFNSRSNNTIMTNDFWPMDLAGTFGGDGHDIKFGHSDYNRYFIGQTTNKLPNSIDNNDHNSYFGFKHKFDFYVDPDYIGPLEYFFYGDDDVWVFLDDDNSATAPILVCDLGGVHDPIGEYVDLRDYIPQGTEGNYSLYMFYLERGGSQSTAYMRLTVPMDEVNEADIIEGCSAQLEISNTVNNIDDPQSFNYLIELKDEAGNVLNGLYAYEKFYSDGTPSGESGVVDFEAINGVWNQSLNDDEKIVIYNLPFGTQYKITQTTRHGFYTTYTLDDNEVIKGNVDRYGNVTDEDTVLGGVLRDSRVLEVDFYNTNYAELPSTGFDGENSVLMYYVPFGIATVYMCAMPFINRTKKSKKGEIEPEQA